MENELLEGWRELQLELAKRVILKDSFSGPKTVGGVDLAFKGKKAIAAAVVLDYETLLPKERATVIEPVDVPYISTYLSFREASPAVSAMKQLKQMPDVLLVDGQGICHPRGLGLASHIGVLMDIPTIGVAKSRLCGDVQKDGSIHLNGKIAGKVLKPNPRSRTLYVSPGHRISLETAVKIVEHCSLGRLPAPSLLAHNLANKRKENMDKGPRVCNCWNGY